MKRCPTYGNIYGDEAVFCNIYGMDLQSPNKDDFLSLPPSKVYSSKRWLGIIILILSALVFVFNLFPFIKFLLFYLDTSSSGISYLILPYLIIYTIMMALCVFCMVIGFYLMRKQMKKMD